VLHGGRPTLDSLISARLAGMWQDPGSSLPLLTLQEHKVKVGLDKVKAKLL
jgi:hypothetical protein